MAVSWQIRDSILIVTLSGAESEDPADAIVGAMADPRFRPGMPLLLDLRHSTENPTAAQVRRRVEKLARLRPHGLSGHCAIVVGQKIHQYGLARMAAIHMEFEGMQVEIFQDFHAAIVWLLTAGKADTAAK